MQVPRPFPRPAGSLAARDHHRPNTQFPPQSLTLGPLQRRNTAPPSIPTPEPPQPEPSRAGPGNRHLSKRRQILPSGRLGTGASRGIWPWQSLFLFRNEEPGGAGHQGEKASSHTDHCHLHTCALTRDAHGHPMTPALAAPMAARLPPKRENNGCFFLRSLSNGT